jgi:hypothetical protein
MLTVSGSYQNYQRWAVSNQLTDTIFFFWGGPTDRRVCTVHEDWRFLLSHVRSLVMPFSAQLAVGGDARPFSLYLTLSLEFLSQKD